MTDVKIFRSALGLVGLDYTTAASLFSERLQRYLSSQAVKDMVRGKSTIHPECWDVLRDLYHRQIEARAAALDLIEEKRPDEIDLLTDTAKSLEWPSEDAHLRVLAMVALSTEIPLTEGQNNDQNKS